MKQLAFLIPFPQEWSGSELMRCSACAGASAGILLYMSLVDLIAIDFISARMRAAGPKVEDRPPLEIHSNIVSGITSLQTPDSQCAIYIITGSSHWQGTSHISCVTLHIVVSFRAADAAGGLHRVVRRRRRDVAAGDMGIVGSSEQHGDMGIVSRERFGLDTLGGSPRPRSGREA